MRKLPEEIRETAVYIFSRIEQREIAELLHIKLSLVKYRIGRAKELSLVKYRIGRAKELLMKELEVKKDEEL
ncbi:hypothetical protein DWX81_04735 [Roseburia inulinivorans]|uniref:hypothetical protein n=1 Tax=Roseburia inulinivorans TaxID=360807 RepID=UPI000E548E41|nr:hypothetical protein [Roseburia inulinivorans]RGS67907.1 hypothetical protein DWX81_04735 [Roseburia inulinivorans]